MPLEVLPQGRKLPGHNARADDGEYVVYHFVATSVIRCTPDGEVLNGANEMGCLFDDLASAQRYCQWKVDHNPKIACTIYDSHGRVAGQVYNSGHLDRLNRANDPRRQLILGSISLFLGGILIWLDARHNWMLVVGFLIGARLAVGGAAKLVLSLWGLHTRSVRVDQAR